ncbi:MAG: hypothetical protein K2H71_06420, partial [Muribaculaceae bacterium]|nr:hypothetical protein [Muribaculaceae bacterium]
VKKMQKVPVNARIVMEVFDGNLEAVRDSLQSDLDPGYGLPQESAPAETENSGETYQAEEPVESESESIEYY